MVGLEILGTTILLASAALAYKRDAVIKHVTSRSLGGLAPGFAATPRGFNVYASLVAFIGVMVAAIGLAAEAIEGVFVFALAAVGFLAASAVAIAGEVRTYRALKR